MRSLVLTLIVFGYSAVANGQPLDKGLQGKMETFWSGFKEHADKPKKIIRHVALSVLVELEKPRLSKKAHKHLASLADCYESCWEFTAQLALDFLDANKSAVNKTWKDGEGLLEGLRNAGNAEGVRKIVLDQLKIKIGKIYSVREETDLDVFPLMTAILLYDMAGGEKAATELERKALATFISGKFHP